MTLLDGSDNTSTNTENGTTTALSHELESELTAEMFGDKWPLTVDSGVVKCLPIGVGAVVFETGGTVRGLIAVAGASQFWVS